MLPSYALLACQLVTAGVFVLSAVGKLRDLAAFAASLEPFGVPAASRTALARGVVAAELAVVALVAWRPVATIGFVLAGALLAVFAAAIVRVVRAGVPVRCRCLGVDGAVLRPAHAWRNAGLCAVALAGAALAARGPAAGGIEAAGAAVVVLLAACLLVLVWAFDDIVDLLGAPRDGAGRTA